MSNTVQVTMRMDADLRDECKQFFASCGLSVSQGVQMALRAMLREGRIVAQPRYNKETLAAMAEADDIITHPEKYKSYTDVDKMMKDIMVAEDEE